MLLSLIDLHVLNRLQAGHTLNEIGGQLSLSHSAISKILHAAEARVGLQLVEQTGRRLVLTPAGRYLAASAEPVLNELQQFEQLIREAQDGQAGPLRVIAAPVPGEYILPRLVAEFRAGFPRADVTLDVVSSAVLWERLVAGKYDLAVAPLPEREEGWLVEKLYEDGPTFFVSRQSHLADKHTVDWDELSDETVIGPFSQPYWRSIWRELAEGKQAVSRALPVRGVEGVKRLVESGAGVGVLFGTTLREEFADGVLQPLNVRDSSMSYPFYVVQQRNIRPLPIVEHFRDFLVARMTRSRVPR